MGPRLPTPNPIRCRDRADPGPTRGRRAPDQGPRRRTLPLRPLGDQRQPPPGDADGARARGRRRDRRARRGRDRIRTRRPRGPGFRPRPAGKCRPYRAGRGPPPSSRSGKANAPATLLGGGLRQPTTRSTAVRFTTTSACRPSPITSSSRRPRRSRSTPQWLPYELAALFGCAVLTGVGAAVENARPDSRRDRTRRGLRPRRGRPLRPPRRSLPGTADPDRCGPGRRQAAKLALELGAGAVIDPGEGNVVDQVKAATDGEGVDLAIETAGSEKVLAQAYAATGLGGMTVTAGLPHPDRKLQIQATSLAAEERTLKGSYLGSCVPIRDIPRFIAMYRDGVLPVDRLLSHRLTPDRSERRIRPARQRRDAPPGSPLRLRCGLATRRPA